MLQKKYLCQKRTITQLLETLQHTAIELYLISFCEGDNTAIAKQYKLWLPELYLISYRYVKNQEQAEDVVADCFEKLLQMPFEKRKQKFIYEQINLKALMIVMVKNRCLDYLKTSKNRNRIIDGIKGLWSTTTNNSAKELFSNESFETMLSCLPEKEQLILKLNIEGYKHEEISEQLKLSEKTISNSLSMSRKKIKNLWDIFME
jgi:RNA polymerase sigma-70 factor (ECF subfamily)